MKQKIYSLIIVFVSAMIFISFCMLNMGSKNNSEIEFEIAFVSGTTSTTVSAVTLSVKTSVKTDSDDTYTKTTVKAVKTEKHTVAVTSELKESDVPETQTESESETVIFPVNINTAGYDELMYLDGIGEKTASAIIEYRETYGDFKNRDELLNVDGIGESKLSDIYDLIFVENESFENSEESYESQVYEESHEEYNEYEDYSSSETEPVTLPEQTDPSAEETSGNIIVNLNTASKEDLMKLPYVDERIADDILNLRDTIQYFSHPYELLMVESLTQEQVAEIINFVITE